MRKINNHPFAPCCIIYLIISILASSCTTLKPIEKIEVLQTLAETDLRKFDGNYDIFSIDSSFRTSEYALTFSDKFNLKYLPQANDRINLLSIDSKHLKVTVFKNDKVITTKIIKGHISQNYFQFKLTKIRPFYFIINGYATQKNRIGLLKNGDLILDTDGGGVLFLIIMPIFGNGGELNNLVYKRKNNNR